VLRKVVTWIFWREERTKNPVSPFFRWIIFSSQEGNGTVGNNEPFQNNNTFRNWGSYSGSYEC
jgi:hypothetical protein